MAKYYPPVLNLRGLFDKAIETETKARGIDTNPPKVEETEEN